MKKLEKEELKKIDGGGIFGITIIAAIGVFLAGVLDGFTRPLSCN